MLDAKITGNRIPGLTRTLPENLSLAVRKAALDVERLAKEAAPVDTGALRASIYVAGADYARAAADAQGANPKAALLEEVLPPPANLSAIVAVGAEHGFYVEYGTERMAPQPFLGPAVDQARPGFEDAVRQAAAQAAREAG